jgi:hypothetical protein
MCALTIFCLNFVFDSRLKHMGNIRIHLNIQTEKIRLWFNERGEHQSVCGKIGLRLGFHSKLLLK